MKKTTFNQVVQNLRKNIKTVSQKEISELKKKFPYCEILHIMSTLKASTEKDVNFYDLLLSSSLYVSNRENLYNLIHPNKNTKLTARELHKFKFEEWLRNSSSKTIKDEQEKKCKPYLRLHYQISYLCYCFSSW